MTNELQTIDQQMMVRPKTAAQIRADVNLIQEVLREVMIQDVHYGIIPGCKEPSLYKPGAEKIASTFRLAVEPVVEDLSSEDEARYRVTCMLTSSGGTFVGAGLGECSSNETKYKWRRVYKLEYEDAAVDRRRIKRSEWNGKIQETMQVRTEIADVANTILKMAKKRAMVDAILTATAASDVFRQDIEDLPEGLLDGDDIPTESTVATPQRKSKPEAKDKPVEQPATGALSEGMLRVLNSRMSAHEITVESFTEHFGCSPEKLDKSRINEAMEWVSA